MCGLPEGPTEAGPSLHLSLLPSPMALGEGASICFSLEADHRCGTRASPQQNWTGAQHQKIPEILQYIQEVSWAWEVREVVICGQDATISSRFRCVSFHFCPRSALAGSTGQGTVGRCWSLQGEGSVDADPPTTSYSPWDPEREIHVLRAQSGRCSSAHLVHSHLLYLLTRQL